jgi:hypothetical protein
MNTLEREFKAGDLVFYLSFHDNNSTGQVILGKVSEYLNDHEIIFCGHKQMFVVSPFNLYSAEKYKVGYLLQEDPDGLPILAGIINLLKDN